jgi:serine/threonine protein kinase
MQYAGTPCYMAPELFAKRQYNEKVDVFAFGTLLWEIIERKVPFDGFDAGEIRAKVESGE